MIAEFALNSSFLETWGQRMLTASWQGGLLLAFAWVVCRFWKQIPASTRCWIWRIAYFKFAIVLLFGGLLQLPILPNSFENEKPIVTAERAEPVTGQRLADRTRVEQPQEMLGEFDLETAAAAVPISSIDRLPTEVDKAWMFYSMLFGIWIVGCAWTMVIVLRHQLMAKKLIANSRPFENEQFISCYRVLCSQLKLSNPPRLATTSEVKSPILVGALRPTILIPESVIRSCGPDELSLIVAHELAHSKRRDLLWNWLPVLVRTCFFFHPLIWLTQSRFALDQEIACDRMALNCTRAQSRKYGNLLVKVSSGTSSQRTPTLAALGVASSFKTLKSRILEMNQFTRQTSQITQLLSMTIVAVGLLFIAPIDLVAQQEGSVRKKVDDETIVESVDRDKKVRRSSNSATVTINEDDTKVTSVQEGGTGNVSVMVSDDGVAESIQVKTKNGEVEVTYSHTVDGQKDVKKYSLDNIEQLAGKNKKAYEFYKDHVTTGGKGSGGSGTSVTVETGKRRGSGRSGTRSIRSSKTRSTGSNAAADEASDSDSSSESSSSSAWQKSTSVGRNGKTINSTSSGTTGNGTVGSGVGNSNRQMIEQINQMIDQTDNAQMKQSLRQLLDQIQNK
jgi:beta-lactamase regulating signal transducer with metallopeptidase domain